MIWEGQHKLRAEGSQASAVARCKETIVAHLDEAFGQDMLQKPADEFFSRESAKPEMASVGGPVLKGDLPVFELDQTAVADGNAENIGGQIFQGGTPIADRLAVYHPILLPNRGRDEGEEVRILQGLPELAFVNLGKRLHRQQEVRLGEQPGLTIRRQPTAWDEVVDVGMVSQIASPGVEDPHQTDLTAHETRIFARS